jgi:hypothetical protein
MTSGTHKEKVEGRSVEGYNAFVKQVQIKDIRLAAAKVDSPDCSYFPAAADVRSRLDSRYENVDKGFRCYTRYNVVIKDNETKTVRARISVTFCVSYASKIPMDDKLFDIFKMVNLPLNTWPYFREFTHSAVTRMGWPPLIAPTFTP